MNNSLLIDNNFLLEFWAKTIDNANYLQNQLLTKNQRDEIILKEIWTGKKQNISHIKSFGSVINILILKKRNTNQIRIRIKREYSSNTVKKWQNISVFGS